MFGTAKKVSENSLKAPHPALSQRELTRVGMLEASSILGFV
jgi:hypothetical protein